MSTNIPPKLIIANWKANKNVAEALQWLEQWKQQEPREHYHYVLCPAYPLLPFMLDLLQLDPPVSLGVQDLSNYPAGAYTGEVNAHNLNNLGVEFAILGHSERRRYLQETAQQVAQKAQLALDNQITPVICIDQEQMENQHAALQAVLNKQQMSKLIIAYEPVHAISTFGGQEDPLPKTLSTIEQFKKLFGQKTPVLYGGNVNPENSLKYLNATEIDGVLVGSASLNAAQLASL